MTTLDDRRDAIAGRLAKLSERYSQSEIARKTGASRNNVNRYIHGTRMPVDVASALVDGLGVNPVWLLTGEGEPFLADVTVDISRTAGDLLEMVQAMNAVARMRMGALSGKHHLSVLRKLNDALRDFEKLRESLDKRTAPIMKELLDRYDHALDLRDVNLVQDLRQAIRQVSRLCHDEALADRFLNLEAWAETHFGNREDALELQRLYFRKVFYRNRRLNDELCREATNLCIVLGAAARVAEGYDIGRSVLAMTRGGEDFDSFHRLHCIVADAELALGRMDDALPRFMRHYHRLSPEARILTAATRARLLLLSGSATFDEVCGISTEHDERRGRTMLGFAVWQEDGPALNLACRRFIDAGPAVTAGSFFARYALCLRDVLAGNRRGWRRFYDNDLQEYRRSLKREALSVQAAVIAVQLPRLAGDLKLARANLEPAVAEFRSVGEELTPGILQLAGHYRNVLALVPPDGASSKLRGLRAEAEAFFHDAVTRGFGAFRETIE